MMVSRLLIFFSFVCIQPIAAQNCLDILHDNTLYSNSNDILNGTKWINDKRYSGNPMLEENFWPQADILYNGVHFTGTLMNYDLYKEELIVFYPEKGHEKYVVISKDKLTSFLFNDTLTHLKHFYEYIELPGFTGKALYENVSVGKTSLFIKPIKKIEQTPGENREGKYYDFYEYYFDAGKGINNFSSKSQLIKILANHRSEVNRYIRKEKINIKDMLPENIISIIKYYEGLN
jgi:hypothetical protein